MKKTINEKAVEAMLLITDECDQLLEPQIVQTARQAKRMNVGDSTNHWRVGDKYFSIGYFYGCFFVKVKKPKTNKAALAT